MAKFESRDRANIMGDLKLKIGCTKEELRKALHLRHQVFNVELNKDSRTLPATKLDEDDFDSICEHVIILDMAKGIVVGTYRMLLGVVARKHHGFYSETKFNLEPLRRLEAPMLEVGRSCIHKDYRRSQVLNLLWQGITQYAIVNRVKYIFGCANIMTTNPQEVNEFFAMFKVLGLFSDMGICPRHKDREIPIKENIKVENPKKVYNKLPTLFKGYMNVGLKVCSYPVRGDFGMPIFFVLLDIQNMNKTYKRRFFGDYLEEKIPVPIDVSR